jgi:putative salt-induced outer membrane protein
VQETNGVTTTERVTASWQPNYKFDDRLYAYGLGQYEHDQFLGYANRYTGGGGLGYRLVAGSKLILDLEGGPVLRQTDFIDEPNETTIAGRASLSMRWKVTPTLQLSQDAAVYVEQGNNNATSTTALDTRLLGALKARFSYNLQYERDTPAGRESLDTLSRATIVYSF